MKGELSQREELCKLQQAEAIVNVLEERDNSATQERREECRSRGLGERGRNVTLD